ncbi:hypothetical protein Tco_0022011, partial [Tanacetum coccineum]
WSATVDRRWPPLTATVDRWSGGCSGDGSGTRIQVWYEDAGLSGSVQGSEKEASRRLTWRTLIGGSRNGSGGY